MNLMMKNLLLVMTMDIQSNMSKKNPIAKEVRTRKYKTRIVKAKKGKGSFKRKKINLV